MIDIAAPGMPGSLREMMRLWTTGVAVVTTRYQALQRGVTVSSFTSASITPPVVMVSLSQDSRTHDLVLQAGCYGVTILAESQQAIAQCFAGSDASLQDCEDDRRFEGWSTHELVTGAPFLNGGLAFIDCKLIETYAVGTNRLFFGQVAAAQAGAAGQPLLYFQRSYRTLTGGVQP